jgi:hypothetical protein
MKPEKEGERIKKEDAGVVHTLSEKKSAANFRCALQRKLKFFEFRKREKREKMTVKKRKKRKKVKKKKKY